MRLNFSKRFANFRNEMETDFGFKEMDLPSRWKEFRLRSSGAIRAFKMTFGQENTVEIN